MKGVGNPEQEKRGEYAQGQEPASLEKSGPNRKRDACPFAAPQAILVGGHDMKMVSARSEVGVERLTTVARFLPTRIDAIKSISKIRPFSIAKQKRGVVNPEIPCAGSQWLHRGGIILVAGHDD